MFRVFKDDRVIFQAMNGILFNVYGRLRSGWRFLLFIILFLFLFRIFSAVASVLLNSLSIGFGNSSLLGRITAATIGLALAIILGWIFGKFMEGLPFRALGTAFTRNWLKDLILGILIGAGTVVVAVLIAVVFGNISFQLNEGAGSSAILVTMGVSALVFLSGAALEETVFRGYILQTFARAELAWLAIIVTSLFFSTVHLGNPNASYLSSVNTALAGIWLGIAYLKTRTLWFVFGLHFAWNWVMGTVFGIEVSGLTEMSVAPLLQEVDLGPRWITGSSYGLEGGVSCTVALIVSGVAIWFLASLKPTEEMLELTSTERQVDRLSQKP